ncbi:prephenate dehydrogenase [bacterium]|nr:prephenate dehydrogenase [bacterium]
MKQKPQFNKMVIAGVGLMGGSLGRAVKRSGIARTIVGLARRQQTLRQAKKMGCIDEGTLLISKAVAGADVVVLAGPVSSTASLLRSMLPYLEPGCLVTDVGSTKTGLLRQINHTLDSYFKNKTSVKRPVFIGSHPMAGSEKSGVAAADKDLYKGSLCMLMPVSTKHAPALRRLKHIWRTAGCSRIMVIKPREHDAFVAMVSHLPHMVAVGLVNQLQTLAGKDRRILESAATGFCDTTRIAGGLPKMWLDILMTNHDQVSLAIEQFIKKMRSMQTMLKKQQKVQLLRELEQASHFRMKMEK